MLDNLLKLRRKIIEALPSDGSPAFRTMKDRLATFQIYNSQTETLATKMAKEDYMPIEIFREPKFPAWQGDRVMARHFLSSGTTSAARARSPFSQEGLHLYRAGALLNFTEVLERVAGRGGATMGGVSLIPPPRVWRDSSLAQMLGWLAEIFPLTFVDDPTDYERVEALLHNLQDPVWLFGTAFHLIPFLDAGRTIPLPEHSIVIETGGTKGKTRSIDRASLYQGIHRTFGVPSSRIISEYGMCELASQAYDWVECGDERGVLSDNISSEHRRFRFPSWVQLKVLTDRQGLQPEGEGALLVIDPLRIDVSAGIRTQDMVKLDKRGCFQLKGRLPVAPLKGCSLSADEFVPREPKKARPALSPSEGVPRVALKKDVHLKVRCQHLIELMNSFLNDTRIKQPLLQELLSQRATEAALSDLKESLPKSSAEWQQAAITATGDKPTPRHWLFILPENHSLVGLYPLAMAYAAGLSVSVRVPGNMTSERGLLIPFAKHLQKGGMDLSLLPNSFRLGRDDPPATTGAILCYGTSDTITNISQLAPNLLVQGFGNRLGVAVSSGAAVEDDARSIAKDAFGLGQRGCMSTRLLVITGDLAPVDLETMATLIMEEGEPYIPDLPGFDIGRDYESWRLERCGFKVWSAFGQPVVAIKRVDATDLKHVELSEIISQRPMTLPALAVDDEPENLIRWLYSQFELGTLTLSESVSSVREFASTLRSTLARRALGKANASGWDGRHEGRALFEALSQK